MSSWLWTWKGQQHWACIVSNEQRAPATTLWWFNIVVGKSQFDQVSNLLFLINYCRVSGGVCLFHVSLWNPLNVKALCVGGHPGKQGLMRSHLGRPPAASSAKLKRIFRGYPCCQPPFAFFLCSGISRPAMFDFSLKGLRLPPFAGRNYLQKATV